MNSDSKISVVRKLQFPNNAIVERGTPKQIFGSPREERTRAFLARFTSARRPEYFI